MGNRFGFGGGPSPAAADAYTHHHPYPPPSIISAPIHGIFPPPPQPSNSPLIPARRATTSVTSLPSPSSSLPLYGVDPYNPAIIHKGLHNQESAYHCFLNVPSSSTQLCIHPQTTARPTLTSCLLPVASSRCWCQVIIQSLWHLSAFRQRFISLDYTHHHREPCVFCALRSIFVAYEYSDSVIIPPDSLRQALHDIDSGHGQGRFLLGVQGDAEEALDEILRWLHAEQVQRDPADARPQEDVVCVPPCISHAVFGAQSMDVRVCRCGATSDPEVSSSFLYRIYISDLLPHLQSTQPFPLILRSLYKAQVYSCPTDLGDADYQCGGPAHVDRWLLSQPLVFTLMLAWNAETTREEIEQVWGALPPLLVLGEFVRVPRSAKGEAGGLEEYALRGVVCYYGRHYVAFFEREGSDSWLMFDDRRVSDVGTWEKMTQRAILGKLQPILVFYQRGEPKEPLRDGRSLAQVSQPHRSAATFASSLACCSSHS